MNDLNKAVDGIEIVLSNSDLLKLTGEDKNYLYGLKCKIWSVIEREAKK